MRSWMSLIMDLIGAELFELFALELQKLLNLTSDLGRVQLWVKSDSNIWIYLLLNKEKLFNFTLFTL